MTSLVLLVCLWPGLFCFAGLACAWLCCCCVDLRSCWYGADFFVCILAFELTGTSLRNSKCLRVDMLISLNGVNELSARA